MFESLKKAKAQHEVINHLENFLVFPKDGGVKIIRILPSNDGRDFFSATRTHKINGKNVHCPRTYDDSKNRWVGNCPICDYIAPLWPKSEKAAPDQQKALQDEYRSLKAHPRFYCNVIARSETDMKTGITSNNVGPKIMSMSKQLFDVVCDAILADPMNPEDVTDVKTGKDFVVAVNKKGEWPDFTKSKFQAKPSPAGTKDEVSTWMANLHDIHGLRKVLTQEALEHEIRVHLGLDKEDEPVKLAPIDPTPLPTGATMMGNSSITSNGTEGLADDDFMAELQKHGLSN